MDHKSIDLLIVGAGPVGCVIAERASTLLGWRSLIVEKRNHVAGNCHDTRGESGILIHSYGPHYFRTNNQRLLRHLSRFTEWIPGNYIVQSYTRGQHFPFPINLTTLEKFFGKSLDPVTAQELLAAKAVRIENPRNSEEFVLSRVGPELYEAFYLGYTLKQWGIHPRDLAPSVCGRIPVRLNRDDRYVDQGHQVMPAEGYTRLFERMIRGDNIQLLLQTDFEMVRNAITPRVATVYCGPPDAYFRYSHGRLGWRSLDFEFKTFAQEFVQPCVQINYPNDFDYTRSVEIKHVTGQAHPQTIVSYEYPRSTGDPYYPIPTATDSETYMRYKALVANEERTKPVYFAGRLATYRYMNMDEAMESALATLEKICAARNSPLDALRDA